MCAKRAAKCAITVNDDKSVEMIKAAQNAPKITENNIVNARENVSF